MPKRSLSACCFHRYEKKIPRAYQMDGSITMFRKAGRRQGERKRQHCRTR
jgi:hypothetical protein